MMGVLMMTGNLFASDIEGRGMWVVRDQITSPEKIVKVINQAVENNFNFLVVQVVGRGDAYYNSKILPRTRALHDQPLTFDPLEMTIELGHKQGLQIIAWLNDMYAAPFGAKERPTHVITQHPDWMTYHYKGGSLMEMGQDEKGPEIEGLFLEPGLPEVKDHIVARYVEIVQHYDVDGVHHDYIRYSNPNLGYHPRNREAFKVQYGIDPLDLKLDSRHVKKEVGFDKYYELKDQWDQFRRDSVTGIIKAVYEGVKAINPEVEVSAAVIGYYKNAYDHKFQDWKLWLEKGYLDVAMPMIYEPQDEVVNYMVEIALQMQGQGVIFPGLGAYTQLDDPASLIRKVEFARENGAKGMIFFSYSAISGTDGYFEALKDALFNEPAQYPKILK